MAEQLDPDIAKLLGEDTEENAASQTKSMPVSGDEGLDPDIAALLGEEPGEEPSEAAKEESQITVHVETSAFFEKVLEGEDKESAKKVREQLNLVLNAPVKEDKILNKQRLTASHWNLYSLIATKVGPSLPVEKRMMLRYGMLDINLLDDNQQKLFRSLKMDKTTEYPFYYTDEWFYEVSQGRAKASMTDESSKKRPDDDTTIKEKIERKQGTREAELLNLRSKITQIEMIEKDFVAKANLLTRHTRYPQFENLPGPYSSDQKAALSEIINDAQKLKQIDKQISDTFMQLEGVDRELNEAKSKTGGTSANAVDSKVIIDEFNSIRQMVKMSIGPQGNHYPVLSREYAPTDASYMLTRENLVKIVEELESIDKGLFIRTFKEEDHRIVPYIILVPCYGESGICWEPFDMTNRATSKGRLAIPMFARNPKKAVLSALADLRWQVAKEKASYHWMEEGVTGKFYGYYSNEKLKGNIKDFFIADYITWITQEYNGMQKLPRDSRAVFWRYIPFPQEKKEELKNKGFFYSDLYQKDSRRAASDGY